MICKATIEKGGFVMKGIGIAAAAGILLIALAACISMKKQKDAKPLQTVSHVDLAQYAGQWFEIARYPNRFQEGCVGSRATYTLREDGRISVINECYDETSGKLRRAEGIARVVDKSSGARLKVSFFRPFYGDYWIIDLGQDYEYAVIGHPERTFLWILGRTGHMENNVYLAILSRLEKQGYDTSRLIKSAPD
jgi:apolipoprotein D and lipocalin family protein